MDSFVPTHSSTESAPTPFVSSLMRAYACFAALGNDVGRAVFEREILPRLVAAHRDDSAGIHLFGREHAHEADRAVADDHDRRTGLHAGRVGRVPAGAEHVRNGQKARDQIIRRHLGGGDQRAVRERNPRQAAPARRS